MTALCAEEVSYGLKRALAADLHMHGACVQDVTTDSVLTVSTSLQVNRSKCRVKVHSSDATRNECMCLFVEATHAHVGHHVIRYRSGCPPVAAEMLIVMVPSCQRPFSPHRNRFPLTSGSSAAIIRPTTVRADPVTDWVGWQTRWEEECLLILTDVLALPRTLRCDWRKLKLDSFFCQRNMNFGFFV